MGQFDEGFLHNIFGLSPVAEHAIGEHVERGLIGTDGMVDIMHGEGRG